MNALRSARFDRRVLQKVLIRSLPVLLVAACFGGGMDGSEWDSDVDGDGTSNVDGSGDGTSSSQHRYWSRNDGQGTAHLYLSGSTAKACSNGTETLGTFNASAPSMTFVIEGDTLVFPLQFEGDSLLVGVPEQGVNTNNATWYAKSDSYPCGGGTTGTDPGGNTSTGTGMASIIFWTQVDHGCGSISVNMAGQYGTISAYYSSTPSCGSSGSANFTLEPGTYTYTAECDLYSWGPSSITLHADTCSSVKLN